MVNDAASRLKLHEEKQRKKNMVRCVLRCKCSHNIFALATKEEYYKRIATGITCEVCGYDGEMVIVEAVE